jgi:hypothetical protein
MPRKMLAANQIFNDDASPNASFDTSGFVPDTSACDVSSTSPIATPVSSKRSQTPAISVTDSPARPRRNTVATESPMKPTKAGLYLSPNRPSEDPLRLQQHISPVAQLNFALDHCGSIVMRNNVC